MWEEISCNAVSRLMIVHYNITNFEVDSVVETDPIICAVFKPRRKVILLYV